MSTVRCPACQAGLVPPVPECPSCGLPLTGPLAGALWQTDQEISALQIRREHLIHALRHPETAVSATPTSSGPEAARRGGRWHGQQVLLAAGALLVLTAAVVFVAVAWSVIGVGGQVTVMGIATAVAGYASVRSARRGLRATAESLAVLTAGLAVVDVGAAYALDLAGLASRNAYGYGAVAAAVLAVAFAGVWSRQLNLLTYPLVAVGAAAAAPALALVAAEAAATLTAVVGLLAAALFTALRLMLPAGWSAARIPLLLVASGYLAVSWGSALYLVFSEDLLGRGGIGALIALTGAAVVGRRAELHRGLHLALDRPVEAVSALLVAAATVTGLAWHPGSATVLSPVLVTVAATVAGCLAWRRGPLTRSPLGVLVVAGQLIALFGVLAIQVTDRADLDRHTAGWLALTVAVAVTATSAVVTAVRRPRVRGLGTAYAAGLAVFLSYTAARPSGLAAVSLAVTAAAVAITGCAAWRRDLTEERVLVPFAALAVLIAVPYAQDDGSPQLLALVLAIAGLTAFAYGVLPGRGLAALAGVACCTAATWTLLWDGDVTTVEAYTLPLAALIAVVGLVRLHRDPAAPSWLTIGPALSAGLLPSAVVTLDDVGLTRPLLVLLAGVVVLVGGVLIRWQSPVLVGSVAVLLVAFAQLAPYAVGLPRWLSFGTLGLLLLVLGARYEQRRRNAQHAVRWVGGLR